MGASFTVEGHPFRVTEWEEHEGILWSNPTLPAVTEVRLTGSVPEGSHLARRLREAHAALALVRVTLTDCDRELSFRAEVEQISPLVRLRSSAGTFAVRRREGDGPR